MNETKYYPMTTSQNILLYANQFCLIRAWLNIASVIDINEEIDEQKMLQAIILAMMRTPSANLRLHKKDKKTIEQYFSNETPEGIELIDMSSLSDEEREAELTKWARIPFPNKAMDTQLYNVKLVKRNNGMYSIFFCVYHMNFDAYAVMTTVRYILDVYIALRDNTSLPNELGSPIPMYEVDYSYNQTEQYQKDKEFWYNYLKKDGEPLFTSLYGKTSPHDIKGKRSGHQHYLLQNKSEQKNLRIPAELVKKVNALAYEWHVSPQSFYQLSMHAYLSMICDTDDICITNAVARRATRVQKRGGGTMINPVIVRTIIDRKNTSFCDSCKTIYANLNETYRHADFMYGDVTAMARELYGIGLMDGYDGFTLTYQSYFAMSGKDMDISFRRLDQGGFTCPGYLTIMPRDSSGDLWCNYEYIIPYYNAQLFEKFHDFMLKFLDLAVASPDEKLEALAQKAL